MTTNYLGFVRRAPIVDKQQVTSAKLAALGRPIIVSSIGRSGTHLMMDLLRWQFTSCSAWKWPGQSLLSINVMMDGLTDHTVPIAPMLASLRRARRPILKSHRWPGNIDALSRAQPAVADWLAAADVVLIFRHPIQALSSLWALLLEQVEHGLYLYDPPTPEVFITQAAFEWNKLGQAALRQGVWFKLEDVVADPAFQLTRLAELVGEQAIGRTPTLPTRPTRLLQFRFDRLFRCKPPSTEITIPLRARRRRPIEWTRERTNIVEQIVGSTMHAIGYDSISPLVDRCMQDQQQSFNRPTLGTSAAQYKITAPAPSSP